MRFSKACTAIVAIGALALGVGPAHAADSVGFVAVATGDVQVQRYGQNSFEAAVQDMEVSVGDTIKTGFDSQAKILLVDDTTLAIDEDTEIVIQSLHVGAAATKDRSIIKQTRGRLRTVVGSAFGGQTRLEVHTPTAVVGVKGTDFTSEEDKEAKKDDRWLYCLVDGKIEVRTDFGLGVPKPGNCIYAYDYKEPSEEFLNPNLPFAISFSSPAMMPSDFAGDAGRTGPVGSGPEGFEPEIEIETEGGNEGSGGDEQGAVTQLDEDDVEQIINQDPDPEPEREEPKGQVGGF